MPSFTAVVAEMRGGGRAVEVPFDGKAEFGEARAAVRGHVNGVPIRSRLAVYGGATYLGLNGEIRQAAGIQLGDEVAITLERDDEPREVQVPPELQEALVSDTRARHAYEVLSFTHRREYARWVGEAKKAETRIRRAHQAVQLLREGLKHP